MGDINFQPITRAMTEWMEKKGVARPASNIQSAAKKSKKKGAFSLIYWDEIV